MANCELSISLIQQHWGPGWGIITMSQKSLFIILSIAIVCLSCLASTFYRGMGHDEGLGSFRKGGQRIVEGEPLYDQEAGIGDAKDPARLVYIAFIALGYKLVGFNLTALHLFPYLFQIINPWLFFVVAYMFTRNIWWGAAGSLMFIVHPFNLIFLNQQHTHPFFVFLLLVISLVFHYAVENPKFLALVGCLASLLILTRLEDGGLFVIIIYAVYLLYRLNSGVPWKWLFVSVGILFFTHVICAYIFDFSLLYPMDYVAELTQRQTAYGARYSFLEATKRVLRYYLNWYVGGKLLAPFLLLFFLMGMIVQFKRGQFYPLAIFLPYFLFLIFLYNGRFEIINLPVTTFTVPGFLLLILSGMQAVCAWVHTRLRRPLLRPVLNTLLIIIVLGLFSRSAYALAILVEDGQPAATMWQIVKNNPPLPGNPTYQQTSVPLNDEQQFPVRLREELFRTVRGNYRSWFLKTIGEYAYEQDLPEKAMNQADFSYHDDYETKDKWEQDRQDLEGNTPLWNGNYPGQLGAFPYGTSASFVYKFEFPKPVKDVTLSDIHTQWGFGDVVKMWTSPDGQQWILRYDNWNVRYTKDYYYQYFPAEFDGQTTLFIKYFFKAGDQNRPADDNCGASLQYFVLAVNYES